MFDVSKLAHDLVLVKDTTYTGPGEMYRTNLWDIFRDVVDETKTSVDLLIGPRNSEQT